MEIITKLWCNWQSTPEGARQEVYEIKVDQVERIEHVLGEPGVMLPHYKVFYANGDMLTHYNPNKELYSIIDTGEDYDQEESNEDEDSY